MKWRKGSCVLCDTKVPLKLKEIFYRTMVRSTVLYGIECWAVNNQHEKISVAEMMTLCWACDKIRNAHIREREGGREGERERGRERGNKSFGHVERISIL